MRKGILAAGNWIIDKVKILDTLPERGMLGSILDETTGNGGAPYNVLMDLSRMNVSFPLYGCGVIGKDSNGDYILNDLKKNNIDSTYIFQSAAAPTSYTDVMTDKETGDRTFYHCRGANALLDINHFTDIHCDAKIFHLGYLLLLDKLDSPDKDYGVVSARILDMMQKKGFKTSVDVVSESGDRFQRLVTPALKYINYLILNEIEAERITGTKIRDGNSINASELGQAVHLLLEKGVQDLVVVHFPEGGYAMTKEGSEYFMPSFLVQNNEIKGTVGAGDAFCAGILYALHENINMDQALKIANANARFNLLHPTSSGGAVEINKINEFIQQGILREPVIKL